MFVFLLISTFTAIAWCVWAETRPPKCARPPVETPPPTPVAVEWDEQTDSIEDTRMMLDKLFAQHSQNDDDIDPPTVVARPHQ